ncbi:MAG: 6-carboxytetrahydropterin synthase [Ignavibacteriales bacterium]|nr:6-carboxytetrahydropterin synthase [Ignavibacteriota bacterium]MCB9249618.1 6-carboxytetrahydropterin synthase [Ignavibacteriales bacterium]
MKIAKEFRWEMGHRLQCHKGKCYNLHGHSYKLIVEFSGGITEEGMVLDYFDVKEIIAPLVDELDHSVIISSKDLELKEAIQKLNSAHVIVDFESTAENLCHYFLNKIKAEKLPPNITKIKVRVCETENTYAEEEVSLIDYSQHD